MNNPVDIQIPNIENELEKIDGNSKNKSQPKAGLFTLIIYAQEPRRFNYLQELVNTILDRFPCRIIFIQGNNQEGHKDYFHVNVSKVISGTNNPGNSQIACDQITISTSSSQLFRVPFITIPHILPDLPVYLLWGQNPFEEHDIFPDLQLYASRVIFDSECSDDLKLFCREMQASMDLLKMDTMDINWALLSNWRDMLAQLFDTPEKLAELENSQSIAISFNDTKTEKFLHPEIRAIYLQGWLASRLKWSYQEIKKIEDNFFISYLTLKTPLTVTLCPQNYPDLPSGGIASIDIVTANGHSLFISRKVNLSQVLVHASTLEQCELPFTLPLPSIHKGMNFIKEIFYLKLGDHYRDMLKEISQIDYKIFNTQ